MKSKERSGSEDALSAEESEYPTHTRQGEGVMWSVSIRPIRRLAECRADWAHGDMITGYVMMLYKLGFFLLYLVHWLMGTFYLLL